MAMSRGGTGTNSDIMGVLRTMVASSLCGAEEVERGRRARNAGLRVVGAMKRRHRSDKKLLEITMKENMLRRKTITDKPRYRRKLQIDAPLTRLHDIKVPTASCMSAVPRYGVGSQSVLVVDSGSAIYS